MEHEEAVRLQMTEQYLLDELSPEAREEFEEHYFECRECAADVGAGAAFVEHSKGIFVEEMSRRPIPDPIFVPVKPGWPAWFRPVLAAPVIAILLAAGYQNLIVLPRLVKELSTPQVLPVASLNIGTFSAEPTVIPALPGGGFEVVLRIPPQDGYSSYTASLYNPGQKLDGTPEWTVTIPSTLAHRDSSNDNAAQDRWAVRVPGAKRQAGAYTIVVRGVTRVGGSEEVGRGSFEFQEQ